MNAVVIATPVITAIVVGVSVKSAALRLIRKIPDVTIVAAWISAETGVGPAIASGSQMPSGICADFPQAPRNRQSVAAVSQAFPPG